MPGVSQSPKEMYADFKVVANQWLAALDTYSDAELYNKPSEGEWCIGQVYTHLLTSGQGFFMRGAKQCVRNEGVHTTEDKNKMGAGLFALGGFPDQKFGMPAPVAQQPPMPDSRESIRQSLLLQIEKMEQLAGEMSGYDPNQKTNHPLFGYLNAGEWYIMNAWHFAHHLRQKARIDAYLGK